MELLKQCQIWHENNEYKKIIDAIEEIPAGERTPEMDSELARAYNNEADGDDKELFRKAISLLKPHEEYFREDHCWNFRMGYAYYYLDQEGPAMYYFKQALKFLPGDEDTQAFIDDCRSRLSLPRFERNFRQRTREAWAAFSEQEAELRQLLDQKNREKVGEEMMRRCGDILELAFENPSFEMGFNGEKYELILSAEGDKAKLFELVYFKRHAPANVLKNWNIWVGRQPSRGFGLRWGNWEVSEQDVQVWVEKQGDEVSLTLYCEKLLPLMAENENHVWQILSILTDQVLGEISSIALINGFDVKDTPQEGRAVYLDKLPEALTEMGLNIRWTAEGYLENSYTAYQFEPNEDKNADLRMDVFAGATRCIPLLNGYLGGEDRVMDSYHADGVAAGFICYPLDSFTGEERGKAVLDFRDELEASILKKVGEDAVTFIGGASGIYHGYLDFIAWDLQAVLNAAIEFLVESHLEYADFHVFRRDAETVRLINQKNKIRWKRDNGYFGIRNISHLC